MPDHPGGADWINDNLAINIEELFEEHEHTKAARKTLYKLPVVGHMDSTGESSGSEQKDGADNK